MDPLILQAEGRSVVEGLAHWGGIVAEAAGILIILLGAVFATVMFGRAIIGRRSFHDSFNAYRRHLGRAILLGLEFLVAADIIGTVLVDPTFHNLGVLAALVAIRTFLSVSVTMEIEGQWPWQRKAEKPDAG